MKGLEPVAGNRLVLLTNGAQYFPALVAALDAARVEVFLETYTFADDATGARVCDALARAAARGVAVRLLIDGFGAYDFPARFRGALEAAGAEVLVFRPLRLGLLPARARLRRMHRKLCAVDGTLAFVGGINVLDDREPDEPGGAPRFDFAVRIEGPLAAGVRAAAALLWARTFRARMRRRWADPRAHAPRPAAAGAQRAALGVRDNLRHRRDIERATLAWLGQAREEAVIACAYFFPGRRLRRALREAARRGVRVVLLLQGRVEYALLHHATRALYGVLLGAGIEIHEYRPAFLHAKVGVFDGRRATVGSSNLDPFSLLLAQEANVFVDDAAFAAALRARLGEALSRDAERVPPEAWARRPLHDRLRAWCAYGLTRLALAFYGFQDWH